MKGLSIEQKAKAYDKVIEKLRDFYRDYDTISHLIDVKEELANLFPELKESEDEKIRKALINYLITDEDNGVSKVGQIPIDNVIVWLEKQEEKKPTLPKWKYKNDNTPLLRDSLILNKYGCVAKSPSGAFVNDVWVIDYDELAKLPKEELEKQGEQETLCDKCRKEHPSHSCQDITELGRCSVEHEQKTDNSYCQENCKGFQETGKCFADGDCKAKREAETIDNVKPKFKVGDWLVQNERRNIVKVVSYSHFDYEVVDTLGYHHKITSDAVENNYHLWSIQDAKDGDILAGSKDEVILIFRGIGNTEWNDVIDYHCCYDCYQEEIIIQKDLNFWGYVKDNELKPVTKEQRDFLFQKIKEAGYVWDSEKKELRKGE